MEQKKIFIGIDLEPKRAMVSLFYEGMREAQTVSAVPGKEEFSIPTVAFLSADGVYSFGREALQKAKQEEGSLLTDLFTKALTEQEVEYKEVLAAFLSYLIAFRERFNGRAMEPYVSIAVPKLTDAVQEMFAFLSNLPDLKNVHLRWMDYTESFFAYIFHQEATVYRHDVALFDYKDNQISSCVLCIDSFGAQKRIVPKEFSFEVPEAAAEDLHKLDLFLTEVIKKTFGKQVVSGVYFIGEAFASSWMKESLRYLAPNRRIFLGTSLYTMGACLSAYRQVVTTGWNYYYDGSYKLKGEVSLKILREGKPHFLKVVSLGENYFAPTEPYYFLYEGNPTLEVWVRVRERMSPQIHTFVLEGVPQRAGKSVRLGVQALPKSAKEVRLCVWDDGFGEFFPSTQQQWEFTIQL